MQKKYLKEDFTAQEWEAAKGKILLAADVSTVEEAETIAATLGPHVGGIKIGLETITAFGGPTAIMAVQNNGGQPFYDGKFDDIPNTTFKASIPLAQKGVRMMNVHASSGGDSIAKAVEAVHGTNTLVLVVTVLTSISPEECIEIFGDLPEVKVPQFARKAIANGAHGVICSPQELKFLEGEEFKGLHKVTPGIQPEYMQSNDQKRVMTPGEAIKAGADFLVIGRAITAPPKDHPFIQGDPLKAIEFITLEIAIAMKEMKEYEEKASFHS